MRLRLSRSSSVQNLTQEQFGVFVEREPVITSCVSCITAAILTLGLDALG